MSPRRPDRTPGPNPEAGSGPAYLAAVGVVVVTFGMGLVTAGEFGRGPWARWVSLAGAAVLALGLSALGVAAWLVGGPEA